MSLLSVAVAESNWYFTPTDVTALHSESADARISYGSDALQFAELRLPKTTGPHPVAIIIHGGCWLSRFADLKNTAALADAIRKMGIATWNIEYRRLDHTGGGWPGTFQDVAMAADFLEQISAQNELDLNKVIVIGHSGGGHLALWLAGRHQLSYSSVLFSSTSLTLRGVISLGGVTDLKAYRNKASNVCGQDVIGMLLGGNEAEITKRYQEASPIVLLPFHIPQRLFVGEDDLAIDLEAHQKYVSLAKEKSENIKLIQIPGAGHHEYNVPNSIAWPLIKKEILDLMR